MSIEQKIQQWILLDEQIKQLGEKTKDLREKKNKLTESILENGLENLPKNKVKVVESRVAEGLTFRYLSRSLSQIIKNPTQVETILNFLKQNREIKTIQELKKIE